MRLTFIIIAATLSACAPMSQLRTLEERGTLTVRPASGGAAHYVISVEYPKDVGFDPRDQTKRDQLAAISLNGLCPSGKIVGETLVTHGDYSPTNSVRSYSIRVRC